MTWSSELSKTAQMLLTRRPSIDDLIQLLTPIGARELCFCFKVVKEC